MAFGLNRRINPTTGAKMEFDNKDKKDIIRLEGGCNIVICLNLYFCNSSE